MELILNFIGYYIKVFYYSIYYVLTFWWKFELNSEFVLPKKDKYDWLYFISFVGTIYSYVFFKNIQEEIGLILMDIITAIVVLHIILCAIRDIYYND